jgi:carbohydrate-binding DOMON domain-containing protein
MLSNKEIKAPFSGSAVYDVADKEKDDKGTGSYTYPSTPLIKPGSLDITHFTVAADKKNVRFTLRFRDLSNPGFHPEYGFQFTYAAIAIDKDSKDKSGQVEVGMNAHYKFGKNFRFETIVYVGGGINVADANGKLLAAYMPVEGDEANPLGDDQAKTIEFTLPVDLIGTPTSTWKYAVLIGAQDDHGGAGIGEFRSVETARSEWTGGGKRKSTDPNVYDTILPK